MQTQTNIKKTAKSAAVTVIFIVSYFIHLPLSAFTYQFSHGNIFHLSANVIPLFYLLKSANDNKTFFHFLIAGYTISVIAYCLIDKNNTIVGASGILYAIYGIYLALRYRSFSNKEFYTNTNIFTLIFSLSFGFFIPNVSGLIHLYSWITGITYGIILVEINKIKRNIEMFHN